MSTGNCRKISREEVEKVQNLIEQCLWNYMNKKQAMDILYREQNIEPIFTKLVWERLEEENQEFFKIYYMKLALKDQITQFNDLLLQQAAAHLNQSKNPLGAVFSGSHMPENVTMKAENMQQYHIPAVVQGGFNGGGPFMQSEIQHGPVNMVVGNQNVNGFAVGGAEGYFGNSRFLYQPGYGGGMESHRFGIMDSIPVSYQSNGTVMDDTRSSQVLRQFGHPESTADFAYTTTVSDTLRSTLGTCFSGENNTRFGDISRNFGFQNFGRDS